MKTLLLILLTLIVSCTKQLTDLAPPVQFELEQNSGMGDPCLTNDCGYPVRLLGYRDETSGCEYTYRIGKSWNQTWFGGKYIYYYSLGMKCDDGRNLITRWSNTGSLMRKSEVKEEAHKRLPITVEFADELIEKVQPEELEE